MNEKYFEQRLRTAVADMECGAKCLKFESPGFVGVPDRIILLPGAKVVFVELKKPGEKERVRQQYVHGVLRKLGFPVFASVSSLEKIDEVIRYCWSEVERERV